MLIFYHERRKPCVCIAINVCGIETGRLMARFCVAFDTMKIFHGISGHETMEELVRLVYHVLPSVHHQSYQNDIVTVRIIGNE